MNLENVDLKLDRVQSGPTPPESEADHDEGKAHLRAPVRDNIPLLKQLFKQPPKQASRRRAKVTRRRLLDPIATSANNTTGRKKADSPLLAGHVHENSTWVKLAVEDVERGLERLATAAKDEHKIDPTKTVEEYYSETLAEIIKGAEIKLDPKHLQ